jgi:C-terminal processing protease CtpA/Prc
VITKFGERTVYDADDLAKAVKRTVPGTSVPVTLYREGKKKDLTVTIDERPTRKRRAVTWFGRGPRMMFFSSSSVEGMSLTELNEQLAEYFGAPNKEGVLVQEVDEGSAADKAGFKAGDVILKVGDRDVDEIRDITRELDDYDEGDQVKFELLRKGSAVSLTLQIEEDEDEWGFRVYPFDESEIRIRHLPPPIKGEIKIDHLEQKLNDLHIRLEEADRDVRQRILRITPEINGVRTRVFSIISV